LPTSKKFPAAHVINYDERLFLIDCGEGTQIQLRKYKYRFAKLNHIFISHLHGDHIFGLPGLLSTLSLLGRKQPLYLYGPTGLETWIKTVLGTIHADLNYPLIVTIVEGNMPIKIVENKQLEIYSFPLKHSIECYGYLIKEKVLPLNISKATIMNYKLSIDEIKAIKEGSDYFDPIANNRIPNSSMCLPAFLPRSYAYCSDTALKTELGDWLHGTDIIFHESTFMEKDRKLANDTHHSTTADAAQIATLAKCKQLLIGHISLRYTNMEEILAETQAIFPNVTLVIDGDEFEIKQIRKGEGFTNNSAI